MNENSAQSSRRSTGPLLALGIGAFAIGTTEFAPMGLLPAIADGTGVSIPTAGGLVTAYAVGVMVGAPLMTLLFSRFGKRTALMLLMGIFIIGNLLSAVAAGYGMLLIGRLITSLSQGAFFGFGAVVATSVVPKERQASAVATMFMGLSIANIGGVPAATWLGQHVSWRIAFGGTVALGLVSLIALALALPWDKPGPRPDPQRELRALINPDMLIAIATTVMFAGALFTVYTYVAPLLEQLTDASGNFVTMALMLIGVGFTLGNWLGGKMADWSLDGASALSLSALAVLSLAMPMTIGTHTGAAATLLIWAVAAFAVVPPLQVRAMKAAADAPSLAAAINIAGFNLGNAVGASVGGGIIGAGIGYSFVPVAAGVLAIIGLLLVWFRRRRERSPQLQPI